MEIQASKSPHPLAWVAAIALILFCGAGVAALMGWIPISIGKPDEHTLAQAVDPDEHGLAHSARPASGAARRAVTKAQPAPASVPVVVAASCAECGVVQSVREIDTKGEGSGLGAVGGAVAGGVLGSQIGGGSGTKIMTVVGAVGGAVAGNEIEKRVKTTKSYEITVRFEDGSSRAFSEASAPSWRAGDKVKVVNGVLQSNA
jgi:outer membrane lipoprotein SlyB